MPEIADDSLGGLDIPVLLLTGEQSPPMFGVMTDELRMLLPDPVRAQIPRAGHAMQVGNPPAYNEIVERFFRTG
jgi:pimeloyl-ACP methyl ester carboxylesterase